MRSTNTVVLIQPRSPRTKRRKRRVQYLFDYSIYFRSINRQEWRLPEKRIFTWTLVISTMSTVHFAFVAQKEAVIADGIIFRRSKVSKVSKVLHYTNKIVYLLFDSRKYVSFFFLFTCYSLSNEL